MDKTEKSTPEISDTRFRVGVTILLAGQLSTLLIPLVSNSNLSDTWKMLLSSTFFFVTPQIGIVWAVAVFGKGGFARLKSIIGRWFKQYGPPEVVGRTRYIIGLFMFMLPVLLGWAGPYYGATDSHTGLTTAEEDNFFGKSTSVEPSATRVTHPFVKSKLGEIPGYKLVASGYQGVWAMENTREAIFDAMERKETYATTGPRIRVRFFGGWEFSENDLRSRAPAFIGYEKGVPMGGDLAKATSGKAPIFMVMALRDEIGANLDRIQIIKGWLDKKGKTHERIYDVAVSDGRKIGSDGRCKTPVGNTVDLEAANWTNTIGASELAKVWTDPDFDPNLKAFYYARIIEIPTPRWVLYDKVRLGAEIPKEAKLIHQERAYTSPIWYNP